MPYAKKAFTEKEFVELTEHPLNQVFNYIQSFFLLNQLSIYHSYKLLKVKPKFLTKQKWQKNTSMIIQNHKFLKLEVFEKTLIYLKIFKI